MTTGNETRGRRVARLRPILVSAVTIAAAALFVVAVVAPPRHPIRPGLRESASRPLLPDLVMGPMPYFGTSLLDGRWDLRFDATFVNQGVGEFLVRADRPNLASFGGWTVVQEIVDADGGYTRRTTQGDLVWAGDEHDHWHVRGVESHRLVRVADGAVVGEVAKVGFCFFDTDRVVPEVAGSPATKVHQSSDCGTLASTGLEMGLSVGWGDTYTWDLPGQNIPIDGVPDGRYRVEVEADPEDRFVELDETNNARCATIELWTDAEGLRRVDVDPGGDEDCDPA